MNILRFDSPFSTGKLIFDVGLLNGGAVGAQPATVAGAAERIITGTGAGDAQDAVAVGVAVRGAIGSGVLTASASAVAGVGGSEGDVTVSLTIAAGRNLADEFGTVHSSLSNIVWEWYDTPGSSAGEPIDSGTFNTNGSGEATLTINNSMLGPGGYGQLFIFHPSDPDIRASLRVPVS